MTNTTAITTTTTEFSKERAYNYIKAFLDKKGIVYKEGHKKEGSFLYLFSKDNNNARAIEIWVRGRKQYQLFTREHIRIDDLENKYHDGYNLQYSNDFNNFEAMMTAFLTHYNNINNTNLSLTIYERKTA